MRYVSLWLWCAGLTVAVPMGGAEITATGISVPFFDVSGRMTHKLHAQSGAIVGTVQHLRDAELVYFSAGNPDEVLQRLRATEATWDEKKQTLSGRGDITVETELNRVSGEGFDLALATGVLHIHRNFKMTNPDLVLTSDRANIDLAMEKSGETVKIRDVKRCEAIGHLHIVVAEAARKKFRVDEAFSQRAIYDGATQIVTLPERVRAFRAGRESAVEMLKINLGEKPTLLR